MIMLSPPRAFTQKQAFRSQASPLRIRHDAAIYPIFHASRARESDSRMTFTSTQYAPPATHAASISLHARLSCRCVYSPPHFTRRGFRRYIIYDSRAPSQRAPRIFAPPASRLFTSPMASRCAYIAARTGQQPSRGERRPILQFRAAISHFAVISPRRN